MLQGSAVTDHIVLQVISQDQHTARSAGKQLQGCSATCAADYLAEQHNMRFKAMVGRTPRKHYTQQHATIRRQNYLQPVGNLGRCLQQDL